MKIIVDMDTFTTLIYHKSFLLSMQDLLAALESKLEELKQNKVKINKQTKSFVEEIIQELVDSIRQQMMMYKKELMDLAETAGYTLTENTSVAIDREELAVILTEKEPTNTTAEADVNTNEQGVE